MTAKEWLYQKLSGILAAYYEVAPENAPYPFFVFRLEDSENVFGVGANRIMTRETWTATVWGKGNSFSPLEMYADSAITALHGQTAAGIVGCVHESLLLEVDGEYRAISLRFQIFTE